MVANAGPSFGRNQSLDIQLALHLRQLRAHSHDCSRCRGAVTTGDHILMCFQGRELVLVCMKDSHILWDVKRAAYASSDGTIYACPDIYAHGDTAEDTAMPLLVTDYVPKLF